MTSKITPEAKARCAAKTMQDQLEDLRRKMQQESGAEDMRTIDAQLRDDSEIDQCRPGANGAF
jgi:hypothetical protein